jgi:hypothetical protein
MKSTRLGIALVLAAAASARAERTLDAAGGAVYVTSIDGTRAEEAVRTPDGREARYEIVASRPIRRVSHADGSLIVNLSVGWDPMLTTALFQYGTADASYTATAQLRDAASGAITGPSVVRTIHLDPGDPGAVLLDASHVQLRTGRLRAVALVRRSSGEAMLVDYDVAGGPVRRTPLGITAPLGSNKGSYIGTSDGRVFGAFASTGGIRLFDLGDLSQTTPLAPVQRATIAGGAGFDPESTRLGIIAILIGLTAQPVPVVSYQRGDEAIASVLEGGAFRTVAREALPPDVSALIEPEGFFWGIYILPYIEQDNFHRLAIGR